MIHNYLFAILLSVLGLSSKGMAEILNQSNLVFKSNSVDAGVADYRPQHICSGTLNQTIDLREIGLSPELLQKGVECVAGDFDGNGFLDFALYKPAPSSKDLRYAAAKVIFFDGAKIKQVSLLENPPTQLWKSGEQGICFRSSTHPDALSQSDGLSQSGGGEYDRTAFFDSKSGKWQLDHCGGE